MCDLHSYILIGHDIERAQNIFLFHGCLREMEKKGEDLSEIASIKVFWCCARITNSALKKKARNAHILLLNKM